MATEQMDWVEAGRHLRGARALQLVRQQRRLGLGQFEGSTPRLGVAFFRILRLYLEHFARRAAPARSWPAAWCPGTRDEAWAAVLARAGAARRRPRATGWPPPPRARPDIAGTVEFARRGQMILRLERPGPGLGMVGAGGPGQAGVRVPPRPAVRRAEG